MAYQLLLILHNFLRWVVLVAGILVIYQSYMGWQNSTKFKPKHRNTALVFISALDTQALLGLLLYFVFSPITSQAFSNMKETMHSAVPRFYTVEHSLVMLIALAIAHIGYSKAKKANADSKRQRILCTYTAIALILILIMIPFGIINEARPMFRY